jgi:hypothetical protein
MILVFAVPLPEVARYTYDAARFAAADTSTEGFHAFLHIPNDRDRVAAALALGELAKPHRNSLLICQDHDDGEAEEKLRFLVDELELRVKPPLRFLWVRGDEWKLAVVRAVMPGNPMVDPRGVWERLP